MTDKPSLNTGGNLVQGLAAVALFAVLAVVFATASFPEAAGFPDGANVVASIGYSMFNIAGGDIAGEGFIVAFIVIAIVLDAALDGALLLAKRDDEQPVIADGGSRESAEAEDGGDA